MTTQQEETRSPFQLAFEQSERELAARFGWPALVDEALGCVQPLGELEGLQKEVERLRIQANMVAPLEESYYAAHREIERLKDELAQAHERKQSLVYFFHGALRAALAGIHPGTTEEGRVVIRGIIEHALKEQTQ